MRSDDPHELLALNELADIDDVEREAARLIRRAGFSSFIYAFANPGDWREVGWSARLNGYGEGWLERYGQEGHNRVDPIPAYCFGTWHARPLLWTPEIYDTPERRAFAEDALNHGIGAGASFPIASKDGHRGVLCFAVDGNDADARAFVAQRQPWSSLITLYVHDAVQRLTPAQATDDSTTSALLPRLTRQELACLQWYAAGKAIWDTSQVMRISESRVKQLRRQLCTKFDVTTMQQAVVRAIAFKIMHP